MKKNVRIFMNRSKKPLALALLGVVTLLAFIPVFTYMYFAADLKDKDTLMNRKDTGIVLLDRHNKPFFTFYQGRSKELVSLAAIPKHMQQAIIAVEDEEFYSHPGFSIRGIIRSMYLDIVKRDLAYGGSTITQQLVKNALLTSKKSVLRKYQEIILAQEIERRFTKDEILEMYLNSVYFGEGAFGVQDAAMTYFGKKVEDLSLAEASMLAGILPSPSRLSPLSSNGDGAKDRQIYVLKKMVEKKYITAQQKTQIEKEKLVYNPQKKDINSLGAHFAFMVRTELVNRYGEEAVSRSGFKVQTTLDLEWQRYAEQVVKQQVDRLAGNNVSNGAAVVIDPKTGEVKALVGSKDWQDDIFGKVNVVTSLQQPGSSFKPIIYAAALENRIITPATVLQDNEKIFQGNYKPRNYDRKFRGPVLMRRALANSLNVPAVEVMEKVGLSEGLAMADTLGITTLGDDTSNYGLSLVLGTGEVKLLEITNAYGAFANNGTNYSPTTILEVNDKYGKQIYSYKPEPREVLSPETSFLISSILSDNNARAEVFGNALTISRQAAVKTGTTDSYRDALTIGYTPTLVVGVWVGNNDNEAMDSVAGSLGAAPIWRSLMERFLAGTPIERFTPPAGIAQRTICRHNGLWAKQATSSALLEYFMEGTEPIQECIVQAPIVIPAVSVSPAPTTAAVSPTQQGNPNDNGNGRRRGGEDSNINIQITPGI